MLLSMISHDPGGQQFTLPPQQLLRVTRGRKCYINPIKSAQTLVGQCFKVHAYKIGCEKNQRCFICFG